MDVTSQSTELSEEIGRRLAVLAETFDLDRLATQGDTTDEIREYYEKSRLGYRYVHSDEGAMHMALNPDGEFDRTGYDGQAELVEARFTPGTADVLELACGNGYNLRRLAADHPEVRFIGIDLVPAQIERAAEHLRDVANATVSVGDFQSLDLPDESIDLVFVVESFCHATNLQLAFSEVCRVLRPGGRFIVVDAWRTPMFETAEPVVRDAAAKVELAMAVSAATTVPAWKATGEQAGLHVLEDLDLTEQVMPNLDRLARVAEKFLSRPRLAKFMRLIVPDTLLMNAVAGYLMPLTVRAGVHSYRLMMLERPAT